jgi:hypothetical protein
LRWSANANHHFPQRIDKPMEKKRRQSGLRLQTDLGKSDGKNEEVSNSVSTEEDWLEEAGEVELIGGWVQVALTDRFARQIDTTDYQVMLTSYDAVAVFVQNRTLRSFEIHAFPGKQGRLSPVRCGYRVVGRRR